MNNAKKVLYTVAAGFVAGAIVGILYAPNKGSETRRKLRTLKDKITCCEDDDLEEFDQDTLEELSKALQEELDKINSRLGKSV